MVQLNNFFKAFISCYFILLQVSPSLTQTLDKSVVQINVDSKYVCGGTLVADQFVVTAAHCVQNIFNKKVEVIRPVTPPTTAAETIEVKEIFSPPNFNPETRDMNVAVLKLNAAFKDDTKVEKAVLCEQSWAHNDPINTYVWTVNATTGEAGTLRNFTANVYGRSLCQPAYPLRFNPDHMFCGYKPDTRVCFRDRGGPVEIKGEFCGIISFGHYCFNQTHPEVFINVGNLDVKLFILKTLAGL